MDTVANNLHIVLKQASNVDGKKEDELLEWSSEASCQPQHLQQRIFNILQGQERLSDNDGGQATAWAACDASNHDLSIVCIISIGGSALFVVRKLEGTTPEDGAAHGHLAWASLREIRVKRFERIKNTPMRSGQGLNEYIYIVDSCRHHPSTCDPPECPADRQY